MSATAILTTRQRQTEYVRVGEFARRYRRSHSCIRAWILDGTLTEFGFSCHQDFRRMWWIKVPVEVSTPLESAPTV